MKSDQLKKPRIDENVKLWKQLALPFNLRQQLAVGLLATFDTLPPDSPDFFPELWSIFRGPNVNQQVPKNGYLYVNLKNHLKEKRKKPSKSCPSLIYSVNILYGAEPEMRIIFKLLSKPQFLGRLNNDEFQPYR